MRARIQRTEQRIINRAVQLSARESRQRPSGGISLMPPGAATTMATDGDGNVYTVEIFLSEEDYTESLTEQTL